MSGIISWCLWWELSNCAKITHHERHFRLCYARICHNRLVQRTLSWLTCISPVKLLLEGCTKLWRGTYQIEFLVLSLAEILNNEPNQGLVMLFNFPIYRAMTLSQPNLSIEKYQRTLLNGISQGDLSVLKFFNMIPYYIYYHMGSCRLVGAKASWFQIHFKQEQQDYCGRVEKEPS